MNAIDNLTVMYLGRLSEYGPTKGIFKNPIPREIKYYTTANLAQRAAYSALSE